MKRKSKLAILIVLVTTVIFVWVPKGKKIKDVSSTTSSVTFSQAIPVTRAVRRKRTEFVDWGRNPFVWPQIKEKADSISDLKLGAIMWSDKKLSAFINGKIVSVGDKITDKTVKQIEPDRVILTDGIKDYVLELK